MDDVISTSPSPENSASLEAKPKRVTRKKTANPTLIETPTRAKKTVAKSVTPPDEASPPPVKKTRVKKTTVAAEPTSSEETTPAPKTKRIVKRKTEASSETTSTPAEAISTTPTEKIIATEEKIKPKRTSTKKGLSSADESAQIESPPIIEKTSEEPRLLKPNQRKVRLQNKAEVNTTPKVVAHSQETQELSAPPQENRFQRNKKVSNVRRISRKPHSLNNPDSEVSQEISTPLTNTEHQIPVIREQARPYNNREHNNGQNRDQNNGFSQKRFQNKNNKFNKNNRFNKKNKPNVVQEEPEEYGPVEEVNGLIELSPKGFGFLRTSDNDFEQANGAIYIAPEIIKKYALRGSQWLHGSAQKTPRGNQLIEIQLVNGCPPEEAKAFPHFDELKAINPNKRFQFETTSERYTTRVVDLMSPVGRGQRGLIVAPPRTGKTVLLQHLAEAILENHKETHLMILLIDERPEEVTEFKRSIPGAEVYASSNDGKVKDHCRLAELCIERAKRLVEKGQDVVILMDSITRLARAYNNANKGTGRTMSGGIDAKALEMPRRLFAAARNTREAGSLTIIATALIETNSRMDELIFQEFKGTGNMELVLNRKIAEQYIYPAVDILKSGTRREELLLPEFALEKIHLIRRALAGHKPIEAIERLLFFLKKYPNNAQMLVDLKQR